MKNDKRYGGRNLVILGLVSVLIAFVTTGVSLAVYHNSGDIYLDRSRPGFMPDEDEAERENETKEGLNYIFDKSGKITAEVLDEYLKKIQIEVNAIDANGDMFDDKVLSNEELGIPNE